MATQLQESYNDALEYVKNITALGGNSQMAEYNTRYINSSIEAAIDRAIAKLNPSQFATKLDMQSMEHRLLKWQLGIAVAIITTNLSVTFAMLKLMLGH